MAQPALTPLSFPSTLNEKAKPRRPNRADELGEEWAEVGGMALFASPLHLRVLIWNATCGTASADTPVFPQHARQENQTKTAS